MILRGLCILLFFVIMSSAQTTTTPTPCACEPTLFGLNYYYQQVVFYTVSIGGGLLIFFPIGIAVGVAMHESISNAFRGAGEWFSNKWHGGKHNYQAIPEEMLPANVIPLYVSSDSRKVILADIQRSCK